MKRFYSGAMFVGSLIAAWTCAGDPTSSLRGGAAFLAITPRQIFVDSGKTTALLVVVRDAQLNPVPAIVTAKSASTAIAVVTADSTRPFIDSSTYAFTVAGGSPGQTKLTVSGGGLSDSVVVNALPIAFNGTVSTLAPKGGDPVTIRATSLLKFNPAKAAVTFGGGKVATVVAGSADSLVVLTPFSDAGPLTIDSILVTYVSGLEVSLPSTFIVHQTGDRWIADSSWQTAPDITAMLPASGKSTKITSAPAGTNNKAVCPEFVLGFGSSGPCMIFTFTLADSTVLAFTTDWEGQATAPDVDIYACSDSTVANFGTACFEDGGAGATSSKPQTTGNFKYPPGTHYFVIENFAGAASRNLNTTISQP